MWPSRSAGKCIALREREFVKAARTLGQAPLQIMLSEILPNVSSTIIIFIPLMIANSILLEAALSYPRSAVSSRLTPSWGTHDQRRGPA